MLATFAFAAILAQAMPPATPEQEARIESVLGVAVKQMSGHVRGCHLPRPNDSDFLAVVGAYGASAVPTVTVAGQNEETSLADITIGEGRNPVYLVLTSQEPVIWRISGESPRIRQLIVFSGNGAGVVGVPSGRIHFTRDRNCQLSFDTDPVRTVEVDVPILAMFGRRANAVGGDYLLYKARLDDSGVTVDRSRSAGDHDLILAGEPADPIFPKSGKDGPSTMELRFRKFLPAGVVEIEPKAVVATGRVEEYKVLPHIAGAYQLERSGALIPATAGDVRRWKDRAVIDGHVRADEIGSLDFYSAYRVTRPIRLPAGLCGGYSMTFFVPSRDYVKGDPCHSNIYIDDGTRMAGH